MNHYTITPSGVPGEKRHFSTLLCRHSLSPNTTASYHPLAGRGFSGKRAFPPILTQKRTALSAACCLQISNERRWWSAVFWCEFEFKKPWLFMVGHIMIIQILESIFQCNVIKHWIRLIFFFFWWIKSPAIKPQKCMFIKQKVLLVWSALCNRDRKKLQGPAGSDPRKYVNFES